MSPSPLVLSALADPKGSANAARAAGHAAGWTAGWVAGYAAAGRKAAAEAMDAARAQAEAAAAAQVRRDAQHAEAVRMLVAAVEAVQARDALVLAAGAEALCAAGVSLAETVLQVALEDSEVAVRSVLARAFSGEDHQSEVVLRVSRRDHPSVVEALETRQALETLSATGAPRGVSVVADDMLAPGDCVAEYPEGYLDARIAAALDRARAALRGSSVEPGRDQSHEEARRSSQSRPGPVLDEEARRSSQSRPGPPFDEEARRSSQSRPGPAFDNAQPPAPAEVSA